MATIRNSLEKITAALRTASIVLLRFYKYCISPFLPQSCRFIPSCSNYAEQSIQTHGVIQGSLLTVTRLCKCHPFTEGGYDPVPETLNNKDNNND